MEHEQQAERMEEDAERMEEHSDRLGERIDDVQGDWERKEQDPAVPGRAAGPGRGRTRTRRRAANDRDT